MRVENEACSSSGVMSKERVGNSWDILNAVFGNKYHQNHSKRFISSDWSQNLQKVSLSFIILCLLVSTCSFDVWSSFKVTMCTLPQCCQQYNQSSTHLLHIVSCLSLLCLQHVLSVGLVKAWLGFSPSLLELVVNPFIASYPCSVHIQVFPKYQCSAAQSQLCSSTVLMSPSHLYMALISQPHNRSGSFLCHFKKH